MGISKNITVSEKPLIRRYLIWCYKTTREELEKTERKFTQLKVDRFLLSDFSVSKKGSKSDREGVVQQISDFQEYIVRKEKEAMDQKYADPKKGLLNAGYQYLSLRFHAIKKAVVHFLGLKELKKIEMIYEEEMLRRIMVAREH
jgi:hypothetical protein